MIDDRSVRYEVVFECRDRPNGDRLCTQLEELADADRLERTDDGPTWAVTMEFADHERAVDFFRGEGYRQFCMDVRRSAQTSVLVVPLGPPEDSA